MIQKQTSSWAPTTIGEVVDVFDSIRIPLNSRQRAERQGPYPYYGASGVIDSVDDFLFNGEYVLVAEDGENLNSRKLPVAFMARGKFWVNNHAHIVKGKPGIADDRYLIAWFANANISGYITGAAQPKLSQANLRRMELRLPSFPLQRKIASILSAYDDLIENNTRRIAILEEMAQAIYREWFVNFRFPGHENVKLVDSPLGQIPEGWEFGTLGDLCESVNDGDWIETKDQGGSDYRLLQVSNVGLGNFRETGKYRYITQDTFERLRCQEVLPGDLLISRMPTPIGRAWLVTEMPWRMITAVDVAIAKPNLSVTGRYYLLCYLNSETHLGLAGQHATGTTRPRVSRRALCGIKTLIPTSDLQFAFDERIEAMFQLATALDKRNGNLRETRDLLLPKLISGKLDVEDLDIDSGLTAEALEEATA